MFANKTILNNLRFLFTTARVVPSTWSQFEVQFIQFPETQSLFGPHATSTKKRLQRKLDFHPIQYLFFQLQPLNKILS